MVLCLLAAVAAVMGGVSTLALRSSLLEQVDERLAAASERAVEAPDRLGDDDPFGGAPTDDLAEDRPTPSDSPTSGQGAAQGYPGCAGTDAGTEDAQGTGLPPALRIPGQDVGTVNVLVQGTDVQSGRLDDRACVRALTDAQLTALLGVATDGEAVTIELPDLGTYRVLAVTTDAGDTAVTGMPASSITATVDTFILVEVLVALAGLLAAAWFATVLVRRELRPLDRVAGTATRVAQLPLASGEVLITERVPEEDTDPATEVGKVGAALNQMLGHVESALTARQESETQVRRFVADASHELRTPLASIRGYAELVQRLPGELPDDAIRAMDRVESEARRMTTLVEDMLLLARLDAGRDLDVTEVDLTALAVDAVADAHVAGPDHVWRLELPDGAQNGDDEEEDEDEEDAPEAPSTEVLGDDHRLRQVLANLLTNARVHTPAGTTVTVVVRRAGDDVVLRVQDDGPGIPADLRDRVFQRFTRADASRARLTGSTGLGLAIVHALVSAHGGTIAVEPTPGGGTTFTVTLPAADSPRAARMSV